MVLTVAVLVGWIYVVLKNYEHTQDWLGGNLWLLVAGVVSLITIMTVLILFSVFLARQILENRRQTTFVDSVTHELRSPLASIRLGLETLGREGLETAQRERVRRMMLSDVERLSAFIDDILEATRIDHGHESHAIGVVELRPLAVRCIEAVTRRHEVSEDSVALRIPDDLFLRTDATSLEVVLKNLLDNAIKYSGRPAEVQLVAQDLPGGRVRIEVIDRGVGIPRGKLRRVFERFYRVDEEAVRARRGTGLGLFVVRALVRGLRGQLWAHSDGPGQGTTMTVILPAEASRGRRRTPSAQVLPS